MIQLQNISFQYAGAEVPVFKQFSLSLQPGRIYGLLGPNGSGKSTLLYIMMGLLHVQEGRVEVDGRDASRRERRLLQDLYIVPEEFELPAMTLTEYVDTYRPFYPHFSPEVLNQCLKEFDLPASLHTSRLSMGQKKKVLMAFALACGTRYLLMDEPTNGLDIASKKQFRRVIASNMTDERTIIIATHQVHDVEQLLDHVLVLATSQRCCATPPCPSSPSSTPSPLPPLPLRKPSTPSARRKAMPASSLAALKMRRHRSASSCFTMLLKALPSS